MIESDFDQAVQLYRTDPRIRAIVDSSVSRAVTDELGSALPDRRSVYEVAERAVLFALGYVLVDNAELKRAMAERDHWRDHAFKVMIIEPIRLNSPLIPTADADKAQLTP